MKSQNIRDQLVDQQVREVDAVTKQEDVTMTCSCKIQFYTILALSISILGLVIFAVLHSRKLKLCRGGLFSNASENNAIHF